MISPVCVRGMPCRLGVVAKRYNSLRYRLIDEFNKQKKTYNYGPEIDNFGTESQHSRLQHDFQNVLAPQDHPKLVGLEPNSREYKYQLMMLQQEFQQEKEKERARWETRERWKGLGAGVAALFGILGTYQVVINYKYLKTYVRGMWVHDVDVSHVNDMNDPRKNTRAVASLVDRFSNEADAGFIAALKDSHSVPGLYLFGAAAEKRLPARVPGFDHMLLRDVLLRDDYVVAIDEKGRVFHYTKKWQGPVEVNMPGKVRQAVWAGDEIYYVAQNGRRIWAGEKLNGETSRDAKSGWFSRGVAYPTHPVATDVLARGEAIDQVAAGKEHLLLLSTKGRLFGVNAVETPQNRGQYGLPRFSRTEAPDLVPVHAAFELTNLNNEVVTLGAGDKHVQPRNFSAIAATSYANAALEQNGNLWTWGDNSECQCGRALSVANDSQPVPRVAYTLKDLARILKYSLADTGKQGTFSADALAAASNTFYVKMTYHPENTSAKNDNSGVSSGTQQMLLSFGAGLKGQLGISRYVHMTHTPLVLKSLVGMREYDETAQATHNIGIKSIVGGADHTFVTLDNAGTQKDVLVFGDNSYGQFGNGRSVKSARPTQVPKLLEPTDFETSTDASPSKTPGKALVKKVNDQSKNRLQLGDGDIKGVEQVVTAGEHTSAIFYRRK